MNGIERWRRRLGVPGLIEHALRLRSDPYRDAALAAARSGHVEEALGFAELLHARVLHELRAQRSGPLPAATAPDLAPLRERVARLEYRLRQGTEAPAAAEEARVELDLAEAELDAALLASELSSGRTLSSEGGSNASARASAVLAQHGLDAALVYLLGPRCTLAFRIDAGGVRLRILEVGESAIAERIARLRGPMESLERGALDLANLGFDVRAARELHELLVEPLALAPGARLALVPDGCLASIPFECLVAGGEALAVDPDRPFAHLAALRYLADEHVTSYYGSLAELARPEEARDGALAIFLAPEALGVPHAREEAAGIARARPARPTRIVADATPLDVATLADGAGILHFVAHGSVDPALPAHGHLLLGGGESGARLESWQIAELDLRGALAVLSACHTGEGPWRAGAGLSGLTRGFLLGGAGAVVASLWAVEDRVTARFMEAFYAAQERGLAVPEALRAARLALRGQDDPRGFSLAHPYFWAAWVAHR